ncbi:hypothetical protein [Mesonia oceanica]|uniref:Uncharacterized protein n=1 Tax=Mesonia oceanica TaxID=2687242 RepID=A0AC61Y542_9FLAO|nr:hypothetical protein [Mesonia oceanica]MAQ39660.1 hypothetical protein [Mesonia sp.]VVU99579.1 hypothetical protein FVB9532_00834 [Mesonia oceanica]
MLKATSLVQAIFVCLLISLFCGALVLTYHYTNLIGSKYENKIKLNQANESFFNFSVQNLGSKSNSEIITSFQGEFPQFNFSLEEKKWGVYTVLIASTYREGDTISKSSILGEVIKRDIPVLELAENNKPLKLGGDVKLFGDILVPYGDFEQIHINNQKNSISRRGKNKKTDLTFKNNYLEDKNFIDFNSLMLKSLKEKVIQEFNKKTVFLSFSKTQRIDNQVLKGNIYIESNDTVIFSKNNLIEDIIVKAPVVVFENEFRGNLQVYATNKIMIEKNVTLTYPSGLYMKSNNELISNEIVVDSLSVVRGNIIVDKLYVNFKYDNHLKLSKGTKVVGTIYCNGITEVEGTVFGGLVTKKLFLHTKSAEYENVLYNVELNTDKIPSDFCSYGRFLGGNPNYYEIKEL